MTRAKTLVSSLLVIASAIAVPACTVRCTGSVGVETTPLVVYQEPPPPQVETVTVRPGHVWVRGRWTWQNGQWVWASGRWEAERSGQMYSEGRWEARGNRWEWVEGR